MKPTKELTERENKILELALKQGGFDDDFELDENFCASEGEDNGAFIRCWLWIDFSETELDKESDDEDES